MKLGTKGRYAIVALVDVAKNQSSGPVAISELSKRQNISLPYLEQLFSKLRRKGLLRSVRGPGGGYKLALSASDIRIEQVLAAVEEKTDALSKGAGAKGGATGTLEQELSDQLWESLSAHIYVFLHKTTLADVIGKSLVPCPALSILTEPVELID